MLIPIPSPLWKDPPVTAVSFKEAPTVTGFPALFLGEGGERVGEIVRSALT